jgi:hypothetical protein
MRPILTLAILCTACAPGDPGPTDSTGTTSDTEEWGQASLDYVTANLVGGFHGEWTMFGLDASDQAAEQFGWTDEITVSNPRIEGDRALVDVISIMDGGSWTSELEFVEGMTIAEDGSMGDYFFEIDGITTILTETSPDFWEYDSDLLPTDLGMMANVTADNLVDGWKHTSKIVSFPDGVEYHEINTTAHVEYDPGSGTVTVEFTSMEGFHERLP